MNNIGIDQKALTVSGETEDYVIAALAVAFPERDCFSIVSLSWK
jgi:enolase